MAAYLVLILAVFSRILPVSLHVVGLNFTAVGGGLLFFGARRSRWQAAIAVLAMMASDYYLTVFAYHYAFQVSAYATTWIWYAAICLLGHQMLSRTSTTLRVATAVLVSSTSFFLLSNFAVWAGSTMYVHTASGLAACFGAAIPFYANDLISTAITAGALFGLPALSRDIANTIRDSHRVAA